MEQEGGRDRGGGAAAGGGVIEREGGRERSRRARGWDEGKREGKDMRAKTGTGGRGGTRAFRMGC